MATRVISTRMVHVRKRVRDPRVVARYHEIREGLPCEWCLKTRKLEANHILHGQKKEDAFWNLVAICHDCHQNPRHGFHGSAPEWPIERALRRKLEEGFVLPREAYAYLEGVDSWPGVDPDPVAAEQLAMEIADRIRCVRSCR